MLVGVMVCEGRKCLWGGVRRREEEGEEGMEEKEEGQC